MPSAAKPTSHSLSVPPEGEQPSLDEQLDAICSRVLAYSKQAKVQRFRYCRKPLQPSSPHSCLQQAIQALETQLAATNRNAICQTLAIDFLRELAALGQQPPCESAALQRTASLKINTALLELR